MIEFENLKMEFSYKLQASGFKLFSNSPKLAACSLKLVAFNQERKNYFKPTK